MKFSLIKMVFRRYRKVMISLVMIAAMAIALMNGMFNAWESMDVTLKKYLAQYGIADAVISADITETDAAEKIRQVDGVSRVIARLTGSTQLIAPSGNLLTAQIISMDKEDFLQMYHWEGDQNPSGDYVMADYWYAEKNGISAGDILQIRTGEDEYRPFTVAAVVSAPETLERTKLNLGGRYYPDFGFLYAPISLLETETEKQLLQMTEEWKEKEQEYLRAEKDLQEAWEEGQAELTTAWEELEKQEKAFTEKQAELKDQLRQLTEGRVQLMLGKKELNDAEATAGERKEQLEQTLERSVGQLLELEDRQAELTEVRNDLYSLLVQLEDAKGRLGTARNLIASKEGELQSTLRILKGARKVWESTNTSGSESLLPEALDGQAKAAIAEIEASLTANGITRENLNEWISQAENGVGQLSSGKASIQNSIAQINQSYLPEIQSYLEETEQGLEIITEVHEMLQNGIAEMEAGLETISDFEQEVPDNREEINSILREVEEGLQAIYSGLSEGETALAEGRKELEEKSSEADEAHSEAEQELAEGAKSLKEAWDELTSWEGYTPMRNEFLLWFDEGVTDPGAVLKAAEAVLDVPVQNSELYGNSQVAAVIEDNLSPLWAMAVLVPLLFVAIMMVVLFLFLSIMIRQSRQSIGILRALGFSKSRVRHVFSAACVVIMLLASLLGGGISIGITWPFNWYFKSFFRLPFYTHSFNGYVYALTVAAFTLLGLAAVTLTSRSLSRIHPAEAVSRTVSAPPKIGRFSRMLLRRAEPLSKFSLLSLRRNPFRFITSVICISGAVSLIFAALSFIVSKNEVIADAFGRKMLYDAQILFTSEQTEESGTIIRQMDCVSAAEQFQAREEEISFRGSSVRKTLLFLDPDTEMVALTDRQGNPMAYPRDGIVLSVTVADKLGVKTGDAVTVGQAEITVTGISRQLAMDFQYLPASENKLFRKAEQSGWMIRLKDGADGSEIAPRLYREKGYVTTILKSVMKKGYDDLFEQFDLYTWMLIALCCIVGAFIVVNTNQNNLQEQTLSLSVLRVIGFQQGQISARWFLQSLLYLVCSLAIGFPVGRIIAIYGLKLLCNSARHLEYIPSLYQYVWAAITTFVFMLAGHLIAARSINKWNLAENTKGRE